MTEPDGRVVNYTYDNNDNLLIQSTTGASYTYTYDARNQARTMTAALDGFNFNSGYNYDLYGRMTGITYPNQINPVVYNYDELDRLSTILGFIDTPCGYDGDNKLKSMTYANGETTQF